MATVYLPMGYPIQQGVNFDLIVYQGNLVRSYTLPKDPRNDSQLFERKMLSDVSKMRGTLGFWGKTAMKEVLGSGWSAILYQLIKSDSFSWWSDAILEWEGFDEVEQDDWRDAAPYKVTFNDMGKIFFLLSRVVGKAIGYYGLASWLVDEWGAGEGSAALAWWSRGKENFSVLSAYYFNTPGMNHRGDWEEMLNNEPQGSYSYVSSGGADDRVELYGFGKEFYLVGDDFSVCGAGEFYFNGVKMSDMDFSEKVESSFDDYVLVLPRKKFFSMVLKNVSGSRISLRYFQIIA